MKKAMITPLRDRYTVDVAGGGQLSVQGNIVDHEYTIESGGTKVAEVSKSGSGCATRTELRSIRGRMTRSSSQSPCASTQMARG